MRDKSILIIFLFFFFSFSSEISVEKVQLNTLKENSYKSCTKKELVEVNSQVISLKIELGSIIKLYDQTEDYLTKIRLEEKIVKVENEMAYVSSRCSYNQGIEADFNSLVTKK